MWILQLFAIKFFNFYFFWKTFFLPTTITHTHTHTHTHDQRPTTHDPRPLPTTSTHDPRPTTFSYTLRITTQIWVVTRYQYGISALFFRRHLAGKPVVASPNVGYFLRLLLYSFVGKTLWQKLSVSKSLSFLWSHVSLNSSICQSEEGLNLFSPDSFSLYISCLHDDAYLSTIVIIEQIKKFTLDIIKPIDSIKHRKDLDQFKIQSCYLKNHCQKVTTNVWENYTE